MVYEFKIESKINSTDNMNDKHHWRDNRSILIDDSKQDFPLQSQYTPNTTTKNNIKELNVFLQFYSDMNMRLG